MFAECVNCRLLILSKIVLITALILSFGGEAMAEYQSVLELNSAMMRNTCKIEGDGSIGSCFLIGRPLKSDPKRAYFVLVTAAHVLDQMKGEEAAIYLRRKQADSFAKIRWRLRIRQGNNALWVRNRLGLDVAVMYVTLPANVDTQLLPISMFADDKVLTKFEIHPGDEMFCLGFPFGLEANEAGFPILRSGKVASFPLVPTQKYNSFLLDFRVYSGNSGGPVYFVESNRNYAGRTHIGKIQFLAGLVSQQVSIKEEVRRLYGAEQQRYPLGLASIIHASHILETISQLPELPESK